MTLELRTVSDRDGLQQLQEPWEALSAAGAGDALFSSYAWNATWWKHYAELGQLHIVVAEDEQRVVGIMPLFLATRTFGEVEIDMIGERKMPVPGKGTKVRVLAYLGSGEICSDFLQPLVLPGREEEIVDAMLGHLKNSGGFDVIDLCDMPAESPVAPAVGKSLARHFGGARRRFRYVAPYAELMGGYDAYLQTLSKKGRFNARKKVRQLQLNHEVVHRNQNDPDTLDTDMDRFIALHLERWNADGLPGVFVNERFIGFHKEMARLGLQCGWLRLGLLEINGELVFATYAYRVGDRVYLYQQGSSADPHWDRYNLGYVALSYAVAEAADDGAAEYNFLRGDAAYKLHWAKLTRELVQWQAARGVRGRAFMLHSKLNTDDELRGKVKRLLGKG
ncbi:MAG: GNAT family N-acetyltransferase [Candidatus Lernaella stagnicola]|nr:GNAT family N-acetyltransferase [Candidatus Lernaella stagnicola]